MKKFLLTFIYYVYTTYIHEDFSIYKSNYFLYLIKIEWFVYSFLTWIYSPILIPEFLLKQSKLYKNIKKLQSEFYLKNLKHGKV